MLSEGMQEMEVISTMLLKVMASGRVEAQLHHSLEQQERVLDELLDTQATAAQLVRGTPPTPHPMPLKSDPGPFQATGPAISRILSLCWEP